MHMPHCFAAFRQLRQLLRYISADCFRSLVVALVHSRLDYGNFVLVGSPAYRLRLLQSVLNAAARLTFRIRRFDNINNSLAVLQWLRVPVRIDYKLAVMAYCSLHGLSPPYLNTLRWVADIPSRRNLRSSTAGRLEVPAHRLATVGRRSFDVSASILRNTQPTDVQFSPSLMPAVFHGTLG